MKKTLAWILILFLGLGGHVPVIRADDSDIFGQNIQPNVLILLDSSGSMNDQIASIPYNPNTTYTNEGYSSTKVYQPDGDDGYTVYTNSVNTSPINTNQSAMDALNTTGWWTGTLSGSTKNLFLGNYLNYTHCSACEGLDTKIHIAKTVIANLVNSVTNVRFGMMKFENNSQQSPAGRGSMVSIIGTAPAT